MRGAEKLLRQRLRVWIGLTSFVFPSAISVSSAHDVRQGRTITDVSGVKRAFLGAAVVSANDPKALIPFYWLARAWSTSTRS